MKPRVRFAKINKENIKGKLQEMDGSDFTRRERERERERDFIGLNRVMINLCQNKSNLQ